MIEWNHNTHYHRHLLKQLPGYCGTALDIGSGLGLFSSGLSAVFGEVCSLEPDFESIEYARKTFGEPGNISFLNDSFMEYDFCDTRFDFISAIASIHHMNFDEALGKMKSLLKPGGRIVILGLYRESSAADFLISLTAVLPNFIMNLLSRRMEKDDCEMVTAEAYMSVREIRTAADRILKKYRFRRHLFWRYSLVYENQKA